MRPALLGARLALALFVAAALFVFIRPAMAEPSFPTLSGRVVDEAGVLDAATRAALAALSEDLERKASDQLVIVTLNSLQGYDIADYGYRLGRHWGVGQQGLDNGVLLIVAPNERKVRIEVGYGLEGSLTDAISAVIIQQAILPRFKAGDLPGGIVDGARAIVQTITAEEAEWRQRAEEAARKDAQSDGAAGLIVVTVVLFIVVVFIFLFRSAFSQKVPRVVTGNSAPSSSWSSSSSSSWSSSSDFSSSSSFSGGGGSFGGGGSSGSW